MSSNLSSEFHFCMSSSLAYSFNLSFVAVRLFLLCSLSAFTLWTGFLHRLRSLVTMTCSEVSTFHHSLLQLIWGVGTVLFHVGFYSHLQGMMRGGLFLSNFIVVGETFFHLFTCADRYLAVVHAVSYRKLVTAHRDKLGAGGSLCVWVLCLIWSIENLKTYPGSPKNALICVLGFSLVVVSFCCISVLWTLLQLGPRENRRCRVDRSKQRAFVTVLAITGVLWLWFLGFILSTAVSQLVLSGTVTSCLVHTSLLWLGIPSSVVLPLLYLHKKRKLPCGKKQE